MGTIPGGKRPPLYVRDSRMNSVIQSQAHPPVVLERNPWTTQALQGRLSAYSGSIFRVSVTCTVARPPWARSSVLCAALWRRLFLIFQES